MYEKNIIRKMLIRKNEDTKKLRKYKIRKKGDAEKPLKNPSSVRTCSGLSGSIIIIFIYLHVYLLHITYHVNPLSQGYSFFKVRTYIYIFVYQHNTQLHNYTSA